MTKNRYTDDFLEFWIKYPSRYNAESDRYYKVGKWEAMQEWKRLSQQDRDDVLVKVRYVRRGKYVLDAHRWLKKRRFDDIELPKDTRPILPKEMTDKVFKQLPRKESRNDARNRNKDRLGVK